MQLIDCPVCKNPYLGKQAIVHHIKMTAKSEVYEYIIKSEDIKVDKRELVNNCPHYKADSINHTP